MSSFDLPQPTYSGMDLYGSSYNNFYGSSDNYDSSSVENSTQSLSDLAQSKKASFEESPGMALYSQMELVEKTQQSTFQNLDFSYDMLRETSPKALQFAAQEISPKESSPKINRDTKPTMEKFLQYMKAQEAPQKPPVAPRPCRVIVKQQPFHVESQLKQPTVVLVQPKTPQPTVPPIPHQATTDAPKGFFIRFLSSLFGRPRSTTAAKTEAVTTKALPVVARPRSVSEPVRPIKAQDLSKLTAAKTQEKAPKKKKQVTFSETVDTVKVEKYLKASKSYAAPFKVLDSVDDDTWNFGVKGTEALKDAKESTDKEPGSFASADEVEALLDELAKQSKEPAAEKVVLARIANIY